MKYVQYGVSKVWYQDILKDTVSGVSEDLNPISTGQGRNQPLYERHVTKSGRNRVKSSLYLLILLPKRH